MHETKTGTGLSSKTLPKELGEEGSLGQWSKAVASQVAAMLDFLEVKDHHVFGHGVGAFVALEHINRVNEKKAQSPSTPGILSLTLASPFVLSGGPTMKQPYEAAQVNL